MGILSEDVIIRLLVDTNKGVSDLKRAETATASLTQKALKMAVAMGGAALAFELAVKAGTALIKYAKEAQAEYVKLIKASDDYAKGVYTEVDAIDALNDALAQRKVARGKEIAQLFEASRARRAERILLELSFNALATLNEQRELEDIYLTSSAKAVREYMQSIVDAAMASRDLIVTIEDQIIALDALERRSLGLDALYGSQGLSMTTRDLTEQLKALTSQYGLMSAAEQIHYTAQKRIEGLDKLIADNAERFLNLFAETGYTYADVTQKIYAMRDAQLELLNVVEETRPAVKTLNDMLDLTFGEDATAQRVAGFNALGNAVNYFLNTAFGDSKAAATAMALINAAGAIVRQYADLPIWAAIPASIAVGAATAAQIAKINGASFADGTPPGGYTVPQGYNGDNFPVSAKSGETVNITRAGEGGGAAQITIMLDSQVLASVTTNLIENRKIVIRQSDVVAA